MILLLVKLGLGRAWNPWTGLTLDQAGDRFWSGSWPMITVGQVRLVMLAASSLTPPCYLRNFGGNIGQKRDFLGPKTPKPSVFLQKKSVNQNIWNKFSLLQWKFVCQRGESQTYLIRSVTELRVFYVFGSSMTIDRTDIEILWGLMHQISVNH